MKKFLAMVLSLMMVLSMVGCASAEGYNGEIKVWVAENTVEFTKAKVEEFKAAHPEYANMTVTVDPVGEGDAASNMLTDVEAGADIFGFAQDQLGRLVSAGALVDVLPETLDAGKLKEAVDSLFETYPAGAVSVYLHMFQNQTEEGWPELQDILDNDPRITIK